MRDTKLAERFDRTRLASDLSWHCEPAQWCLDPARGILRISPNANTDFWQRTHYGFEADSGHFLYLRTAGDFTLTTKATSHPRHQYDQAGLMVRLSPACWLKASVEFEPPEANRLGAVVTNAQYSELLLSGGILSKEKAMGSKHNRDFYPCKHTYTPHSPPGWICRTGVWP